MNTSECQALIERAEQARLAAGSSANRQVFVANCEHDWAANAARYAELGKAVPPNDCAYRGYGLTLPGTTGSFTGYLPGTPQEVIDWRNANPGGGSPGPAAGGSAAGGGGGALQFSFTNLTSGDNSNFRVGDRWEVRISGAAPNSPVSVNGGLNGANVLTQMGSTDAAGRFILNGQMEQGQVGNWSEAWRVNNQIVQSFTFRVLPAGTAAGATTFTGSTGGGQTQSPITKSVFGALPGGSISIGGTDIPWAVLGGGLLVAFLIFRGGR